MADLTVIRVVKPPHFRFRQFWVLAEVRESLEPKVNARFEKLLMFNTQAEAEKVKPGYHFKEM